MYKDLPPNAVQSPSWLVPKGHLVVKASLSAANRPGFSPARSETEKTGLGSIETTQYAPNRGPHTRTNELLEGLLNLGYAIQF